MKRKNYLVLFITSILLVLLPRLSAQAGSVYQSHYVSFSPDGQAFTTHSKDKNYEQYPYGTTIYTGIQSGVKDLEEGEHYYKSKSSGNAPIGRWTVNHQYAQCIHNAYGIEGLYHGVFFGRSNCLSRYFSGWNAYCADCGDLLEQPLIYMSIDAARTITELNLD
ncbi:MAG: hypothetical protein LBM69_07425, partial [Lachnospiraceae bacterium]|nr:hypothetical protein [Lachnospiraceae bacterium]